MRTYKIHGQVIKAKNEFHAYSIRFNCSLAEALADRDYPMSKAKLVELFEQSIGRAPNESELNTMRADSIETINNEIDYLRE